MNVKQLIAAVAVFAAAGSAFADVTGNFTDFVNMPSSKTRAEVVAELQQAQTQGTYVAGGEAFVTPSSQLAANTATQSNAAVVATPAKTRAQVVAELKQAQADGSYVVGGETFVRPNSFANNGRTRDAVRNEAMATERSNKTMTQESGN